jgi:hypothetical protein
VLARRPGSSKVVLLAPGVAIWVNPVVPEVELRSIRNPVWSVALFVQASLIPLDDVAVATRFDGVAAGDGTLTMTIAVALLVASARLVAMTW